MQAFVDGKKVRCKTKDGNEWPESWRVVRQDDCDLEWDWDKNVYEVVKEPEYRPLKSEELHELKGKWLISNMSQNLVMVTGINSESKMALVGNIWRSTSDLLSELTFEDGSPVGKSEE